MERTREEREVRLDTEKAHVFALNAIASSVRDEPEYERNGRNGMTLVKDRDLRVVLETVKAGGGLPDHYAPGRCTIHVLEGEIRVKISGNDTTLRRGELLALPTREPHSVEGVMDSVFLLTIAPTVTSAPGGEPSPLTEPPRD
jgi:quercetin dioxygenase-like cupin family protein